MAAKQFFLPYAAATINAVAEPGAQLAFYTTGTTTKLPVYTSSALTTTQSNPVVANSAGRFPDIYLNDSLTYRLKILDRNGALLDDIDPFVPGNLLFDITGTGITPELYGAELDNVTNDSAAYVAAIAASATAGGNANGGGFFVGGAPVELASGKTGYVGGTTGLNVNHTVRIKGGGGGRYGPGARGVSAIRYGAGSCGLLIQGPNTHSVSGTDVTAHAGAGHVALESLMLQGPEDGVEDAADIGLVLRKQVTGYDGYIRGFRGPGVQGYTGTYNTVTYNGDVSMTTFYSWKVEGCLVGYQFAGGDANILNFINSEAYQNFQAGFVFDVGIGAITLIGPHTASNGMIAGHLSYMCHHNGDGTDRLYAATWGKTNAELTTNAPPNGATSNAYWNYVRNGAADAVIKTWNGTQQFRAGGDFLTSGPVNENQAVTLISPYAEEPGVSQFGPGTLIINPAMSRYQRIGGVCIYAQSNLFKCDEGVDFGGNITARGFVHTIGDGASATVSNTDLYIANTSTSSTVWFTQNGTVKGYVSCTAGSGTSYLAPSTSGHIFNVGPFGGSTSIATIDTLGIRVVSGSLGYGTGVGGAVTQTGSRTTTTPAINKPCGQITLVSAAGSASWQTFTVANTSVAATDVIRVIQASGTDKYMIHVTKVVAGTSFDITFATTGGTTTEQPVFNFAVLKAVAA